MRAVKCGATASKKVLIPIRLENLNIALKVKMQKLKFRRFSPAKLNNFYEVNSIILNFKF